MTHPIQFNDNRVLLQLHGERISTDARTFFAEHYTVNHYEEATHIQANTGEIWLFDYGVSVCWGVSEKDFSDFVYQLKQFVIEPRDCPVDEQFRFRLREDADFSIHMDLVSLNNHDPLTRLAVSHAFAQEQKLTLFEDDAQEVIRTNRRLSKDLAEHGKISLSLKSLSKLRGALFERRSDIFLKYSLLDTPEFFWHNPELEQFYLSTTRYLELKPRIEILNRKLEIIHELVEMLAAEQHQKHSSFLEWIVIILIAIEVLVNLPGHMGIW